MATEKQEIYWKSLKGKVPWNKGLRIGKRIHTEKMDAYYKTLKGSGNPFYNKRHTLVTKEKMRLRKQDGLSEETRRRMSESCRGRIPWNKGLTKGQMPVTSYSAERNAKVGRKGNTNGFKKGHCETLEQRVFRTGRLRQAYAERYGEIIGKILLNSGKKRFSYISRTSDIIKMRSNWERLYAAYLDRLGYNWFYESRGFKLSNNKLYYPDFFIEELNEWHEVKGYLSDIATKKIKLFGEEYPQEKLVLISKEKINEIKNKLSAEAFVANTEVIS